MMRKGFTTPCPCCKGSGVLMVYAADLASMLPPNRETCCHCSGEGVVPIEVEPVERVEVFDSTSRAHITLGDVILGN